MNILKVVNTSKLIIFIGLIFIFSSLLAINSAKSRTKSYYSGSAINWQGQLVVGSTNMGKAEIFALEDGRYLVKKAEIQANKDRYSDQRGYFDITFHEDSGTLYAYLVDGRYLYKYELNDLASPRLIRQIKDNSWDWFMGVDTLDGKIITTGPKSVKVYNSDLTVIDSFWLKTLRPDNIIFTSSGNHIMQIDKDLLKIFSVPERKVTASRELLVNGEHNSALYNDPIESAIYAVDDEALKKIFFNGEVADIFYHISDIGYEVEGIDGRDYVYFSDGIGVVKIRKNDLEPLDWAYTNSHPLPNGWAIGLEVVPDGYGEMVVVFNNNSILVLDDKLQTIAYYEARDEDSGPYEILSLGADKSRAPIGGLVSVHGQGFWANEEITITLERHKFPAKADGNGRFTKIIEVPAVDKKIRTEIKATGVLSKLHYSVSFEIEK